MVHNFQAQPGSEEPPQDHGQFVTGLTGTLTPSNGVKMKHPEEYSGRRDATTVKRWLFRVAYFCQCNGLAPTQWAPYAGSLLAGIAADWWQAHLIELGFPTSPIAISWDQFSVALSRKFIPVLDVEHAKDKLRECRQRTSAARYVEEFEELRQNIGDGSHDFLHAFIYGLKPEIKAQVRLQRPSTLQDAQTCAIETDDILFSSRRPKAPPAQTQGQYTNGAQRRYGSAPSPMELDMVEQHRAQGGIPMARNGRAITCFHCGKVGHYKSECSAMHSRDTTRRTDEGGRTLPRRAVNLLDEEQPKNV